MKFIKFVPIGILLVSCIGCDQLTKQYVKARLSDAPSRGYFNDMIEFQYAENPGAMLSLGAHLPQEARFWIFIVFAGLALIGMLLFTLLNHDIPISMSMAMTITIAGGISNILDRLFNDGHVIDFMIVTIGSVRTGIFNIADVFITMGVGLLIVQSIMYWLTPKLR